MSYEVERGDTETVVRFYQIVSRSALPGHGLELLELAAMGRLVFDFTACEVLSVSWLTLVHRVSALGDEVYVHGLSLVLREKAELAGLEFRWA